MNNNDFFSIDKLVEFGMSAAIATQMVETMNQSMRGMYVTGSYMPTPPQGYGVPQAIPSNGQVRPDTPGLTDIYILVDGRKVGPLSDSEFVDLVKKKIVVKDTMAWFPGREGWKPVSEIPSLLKIILLS